MLIITQEKTDPGLVIKTLNSGGLVIFPCETVYGAAVDADNPEAVKILNQYKQRPWGKPYAIMVSDQQMAEKYVELNKTGINLYKNFLPGPLTVVSQGKHRLAPGVESERGTLGVRIPAYPFIQKLISRFGRAIVATSANASYKKRPYKVSDILDNLSEKQNKLIDLIIDAGELPHNEPSTVIDTTLDDITVLRQGEVFFNNRLSVISFSEEQTQNTGKELWQKYEKYFGLRAIVFALEGPMGVGKTQFTKGLAKAMGIEDEIVSPTFNLELDYDEKLFHVDAWRIQNGEELENLGLKNLINDKSVIAIEWADRVAETIRKYNEEALVVWVKMEYRTKINERMISWGNL
jgi:L-threonylcarbamoyladenylate synthase